MTIAIIGAGLSGLSCAHRLVAAGIDVALLDKGRGPGGRMSTRRAATPLGEARFDHGCQYFTARDPDFRKELAAWEAAGAAAHWTGRIAENTVAAPTHWLEKPATSPRWTGTPGMNAIIRHLAEPLNVRWGVRASDLTGEAGDWTIKTEDDQTLGPFQAVLSAVPAEQVSPLLGGQSKELSHAAAGVTSTPCWTVMALFEAPREMEWAGLAPASGPLAWACNNQSKPGRGELSTWVLQASPGWSAAHIEDPAAQICDQLVKAFSDLTGSPDPIHVAAHRWRYAFPQVPAGMPPAQFDADKRLGTCGDWHLAPNSEGAWLSGRALADLVITST